MNVGSLSQIKNGMSVGCWVTNETAQDEPGSPRVKVSHASGPRGRWAGRLDSCAPWLVFSARSHRSANVWHPRHHAEVQTMSLAAVSESSSPAQ